MPNKSAPRLTWTIVLMGASVLVSVILNYAAYDTRITVLEGVILKLSSKTDQYEKIHSELLEEGYKRTARIVALERDMANLINRIQRIEKGIDNDVN